MSEAIKMDANGVMLRPTRWDMCVRRRAAEMALPVARKWLGRHDSTDEEIMADLADCLGECDGYEIARALDDKGWSMCLGFASDLDQDFSDGAAKEMVRQWVQCLGVKPVFAVGDGVRYRGGTGIIAAVDTELAQYRVHTPEQKPRTNWVANFEDVTAVPVAQEAVAA